MNIIATQGYKNSGKTEVAQMLQFLMNSPSWMHKYWIYKRMKDFNWSDDKYQIVSYADRLKQVAATLIGVPVENFNDRDFKENYYVDFTSLTIFHKDTLPDTFLTMSDLKFTKEFKKLGSNLAKTYYLSMRQLMQYLGTEVLREYFGANLWVLGTLNQNQYKNIIISDQRFLNEFKASSKAGGITIHIKRPGCTAGTHASETEVTILEDGKKYDHMIINNGTLRNLFGKCKYIVNGFIKPWKQ